MGASVEGLNGFMRHLQAGFGSMSSKVLQLIGREALQDEVWVLNHQLRVRAFM